MTIEMLDRGTILVSLCEEDMRYYSLDFSDKTAGKVEMGLKNLLYRVGEVCGIDYHGKSYLIEALPARSGCLLIVTVRTVRRRRVYRVKRPRTGEVCVFLDADAMLDGLRRVSCPYGCSVYRYDRRYILLSDGEKLPQSLCEYGALLSLSTAVQARVREHGTLLWQNSAQRRHIGGGTVAVGNTAFRHADR